MARSVAALLIVDASEGDATDTLTHRNCAWRFTGIALAAVIGAVAAVSLVAFMSNNRSLRGSSADASFSSIADSIRLQAGDVCHDAVAGEQCFTAITWAMSKGIFENHAEWYPGLHPGSTFQEFQAVLSQKGHGNCPSPCGVMAEASTSFQFDCDAAFNNWLAAWSDLKKEWCCKHEGRGCPSDPKPTAPALASPAVTTTLAANAKDCTKNGADCTTSKCCSEPGMQCYVKNEHWASCNQSCEAGIHAGDLDGKPWSCQALGPRSESKAHYAAAAAGSHCEWPGKDCRSSKCCRVQEMNCYEKDQYFATCELNCSDPSWSCKILGGGQLPNQIAAAGLGQPVAGTSLYCITVVSEHLGPPGVACPDNIPCPDRHPYEHALVLAQQASNTGIFACDKFKTFDSEVIKGQAKWRSFANTDVFLKIWQQVYDEKVFLNYDWVVKVDPDAVFFPDRLKYRLNQMRPPADIAMYIKNCNFKFEFMGALEIFSAKALEVYLGRGHFGSRTGAAWCDMKLGHDGGEDFYMKTCMDAMGVGFMKDALLLTDKYTLGTEECMAAGTCKFDAKDISTCRNGDSVAFHPYKEVSTWMACHTAAIQVAAPAVV